MTVWTPDGETQRHQPRAAQHAPQEEGAPGAGTLLRPSSVRAGGEQVWDHCLQRPVDDSREPNTQVTGSTGDTDG